jgi:hypothetical protein
MLLPPWPMTRVLITVVLQVGMPRKLLDLAYFATAFEQAFRRQRRFAAEFERILSVSI